MGFRRFRNAVTTAAMATALVAFGAWDADAQTPKKGGKLRIAILADIGGFDSMKVPVTGRQRAFVMEAIHEHLFDIDPETFKIVPRLGLKAEPSDDFKRWRVTLRQGVKFSNGEEMTAQDYKAHFDRLLGSKFGGRFRGTLGPRLDRVEAPGKYTIDFIFSEASPGWETIMANPDLLWWVRPKSWLEANKDKPELNTTTVGVGPYVIKQWRRGSSIVLAKNPHYWDKDNQHVDEIRFTIINQQISRFQALQSGQMDLVWVPPWLKDDAEQDKRLATSNGPNFFAGLGVAWNNQKPPFDDVRVRKALVHALDRKPLTGVITKIPKDPPIDMFGRGHPWHCPDTAWPEYNPEKAKALLADYGKPVKFTLNIVGLRDLIRVAETFQAYWKEVGVEVVVKPGPRGPQWARAVQSGKFDVWWNNYGANADPSLVAMNFHSKSRANIYKVNDPGVDKAIDAMKAARGKDARYKASCNLQKVLADQIRWLGWEQGDVTVAMWPYVKGLPRPINIWPKYYRVWLDK